MNYATYYGIYKNVKLEVSNYTYGGGIYIGVYNDEEGPISNLTVNVPGYNLKANEAFIDTNNAPEALDFIKQYKLGEVTEEFAISGFCSYPKVIFDMDKISECKGEENGFADSINYDEEEKYA